jgi:tripartite-type tricarboxylate transporter receptor subunit TctC
VPADSPANTVAELVRWGKTKPDGLSFASQGIGSGGHLLAELFKRRTGIAAEHVPYKGSAPALQDMLAGRVDFFFDAVITSLPHIKQGRLKALALATSQRLPLLPNVPTLAQVGYAGVEADHWFGVFVPAGTPPVVVKILHAEFTKAMANPEVNNKLTAQGLDVLTSSPSEFAALLQRDNTRYARLVQDAGARLD